MWIAPGAKDSAALYTFITADSRLATELALASCAIFLCGSKQCTAPPGPARAAKNTAYEPKLLRARVCVCVLMCL